MKKSISFLLIIFACLVVVNSAQAGAYVTSATGGEEISIGDVGGAWTSLTPIKIQEGMPGDIRTGDIIFKLPDGFEFNTSSSPDIVVSGGTELLAHFTSASSSELKITVTQVSATINHTLTIGGVNSIQVRPTDSNLPSGNIYMASSIVQGVVSGPEGTSFGVLATISVEEPEEPEEPEQPGEPEEPEEPEEETIKEKLREQIIELQKQIIEVLQRLIQLLQEQLSSYL